MADGPKISPNARVLEISGSSVVRGSMRPMMTQTQTAEVNFHQIEDKELQSLIDINSPVSLGLSTMTAGGLIGLLPTITPSLLKIWKDGSTTIPDLMYIIVAVVCLVLTIIYGYRSAKDLSKSKSSIEEIRKRPKRPI